MDLQLLAVSDLEINYKWWSLICWLVVFAIGAAIGWYIRWRRLQEYDRYDRDYKALLLAYNKRRRAFEENREIVASITSNEIKKNRR